MFDRKAFEEERSAQRTRQHTNLDLQKHALSAFEASDRENYSYQFNWMGMPIIQAPEAIVMVK